MTAQTLGWKTATIEQVIPETPRVKSFHLSVPGLSRYRPGQHVDVRLTAPDGYQAQRSYSLASAPGITETVEITVELIDDGEVSPYFHEVASEGDTFEVRGPIGGPFTWQVEDGGPLLLVGGGSGVVPLMSMLRHRAVSSNGNQVPAALLYSSRSEEELIYRAELEEMAESDEKFFLAETLTRSQPADWMGFGRRVDSEMLHSVIDPLGEPVLSYVCGPTGFVESVAALLVDRGLPPGSIRTERFGPTGT